eukprot:TRINITY_DN17327_c0_g1_i1.p1 TRINITY_DN17327_c0_g1~~TRINITY_DN17327_c0_g1_i1.p1  ORF type:complete len:207 (+),score=30.33 TRINITY_DN17327_c0_g1_i1:60-680(+)
MDADSRSSALPPPSHNPSASESSSQLPPPSNPNSRAHALRASFDTEGLEILRTHSAATSASVGTDAWEAGVEFSAPNGDAVRFVPTGRVGELAEFVAPKGSDWIYVGRCRELHFDGPSRTLSDERGSGGVLPRAGLPELLERLADLCERCSVQHNVPGDPRGVFDGTTVGWNPNTFETLARLGTDTVRGLGKKVSLGVVKVRQGVF